MANTTSQPFRFLDLPAELGRIVYKLMPNHTIRTRYVKRSSDGGVTSSFTIITYTAPTAILATCKIIKNEAAAIILKATQQLLPGPEFNELSPFVAGIAPRIETDSPGFRILGADSGLIKAIFDWYSCLCLPTPQHPDCRTSLAFHGYNVSSLLKEHGYVMEGGTLKEGARHLLNFIRKSGWILYLGRRNRWFKNRFFHAVHITLVKDAKTVYDTVHAVEGFGKALSTCDITYGFCVKIHTVSTVSALTSQEVRSGQSANALQLLRSQMDFSEPTYAPTLEEGVYNLDEECKEAYNQFWREGEWEL